MAESNDHMDAAKHFTVPRRAKYLFVLGLSAYTAIAWYVGWQDVRDELLNARFSLVLVSGLTILAATWARVWKWRYALGLDHSATGLYFVSKATGNWTPGRVGEFAPMALKSQRTPKVGGWILFDRLLEIAVTLALGLFGLAMIQLMTAPQLAALTAAVAAGGTAGLYLVTRRSVFVKLAGKRPEGSMLHKVAMLFAAMSEEFHVFARKLPVASAITVVTKCADLWAVSLIFVALGYHPGFALMAAAKCALAIVSFIPITPSATMVPHGVQMWLMHETAAIPYEALIAGVGIEVLVVSVTFWGSFWAALPRIDALTVESPTH